MDLGIGGEGVDSNMKRIAGISHEMDSLLNFFFSNLNGFLHVVSCILRGNLCRVMNGNLHSEVFLENILFLH